jgi:hypothetical protein
MGYIVRKDGQVFSEEEIERLAKLIMLLGSVVGNPTFLKISYFRQPTDQEQFFRRVTKAKSVGFSHPFRFDKKYIRFDKEIEEIVRTISRKEIGRLHEITAQITLVGQAIGEVFDRSRYLDREYILKIACIESLAFTYKKRYGFKQSSKVNLNSRNQDLIVSYLRELNFPVEDDLVKGFSTIRNKYLHEGILSTTRDYIGKDERFGFDQYIENILNYLIRLDLIIFISVIYELGLEGWQKYETTDLLKKINSKEDLREFEKELRGAPRIRNGALIY